ncbi:MAG: acyltransferase family protein, partial [Pseudomonadota bacterium]
MTKLRSVQALRAIAALLVFGCHLISIEARHAERDTFLTYVMENGAYGVDLFFVISGFIMVWVAGDTPQSLKHAGNFFYARVTRIYPLWWLFAGA